MTETMTHNREETLDDMHKAALLLIKFIENEKRHSSGGASWHAVEAALLDIREAWENAKACEVLMSCV